ncbi:MAG: periplasmic heavy metal sensor [Gemmatimonadales bacterium]
MMFSRSKAWAVALLAAVFLAGGAVGWAASGWSDASHQRRGRGPRGMAEYLARRLDLSPVQRDSVRAILARHHTDMKAIWGAMRPRFDSLRAVVSDEIRVQLTPDQQERYARLLSEFEHQHEKHEKRERRDDP